MAGFFSVIISAGFCAIVRRSRASDGPNIPCCTPLDSDSLENGNWDANTPCIAFHLSGDELRFETGIVSVASGEDDAETSGVRGRSSKIALEVSTFRSRFCFSLLNLRITSSASFACFSLASESTCVVNFQAGDLVVDSPGSEIDFAGGVVTMDICPMQIHVGSQILIVRSCENEHSRPGCGTLNTANTLSSCADQLLVAAQVTIAALFIDSGSC